MKYRLVANGETLMTYDTSVGYTLPDGRQVDDATLQRLRLVMQTAYWPNKEFWLTAEKAGAIWVKEDVEGV